MGGLRSILGIWVAAALLAASLPAIAQDGVNGVSEQQLAASSLRGLLANNESISDYDVIVHTVKYSDEPEAQISRWESTSRIVCRNGDVKVFARRFTIDNFGGSEDASGTVSRIELSLFTDADGVYSIGPSGKANFQVRSKPIHLSRLGCPRFISLGVRGFPDTRSQPEYASVEWERLLAGASFRSAKIEGSVAVFKASERVRTGDTRRSQWKFSLSDLVPLERSVEMTYASGRTHVKERESISWQEYGGVMHPLIVRRELTQSKRLSSGEVVDYLELIDSELEWRSIDSKADPAGNLSPSSFPTLASVDLFLNGDAP